MFWLVSCGKLYTSHTGSVYLYIQDLTLDNSALLKALINPSILVTGFSLFIDNTIFEKKTSFLKIEMNGKKEIITVKIDVDKIESDEIEILEDLIQVTINELNKKIDSETENKLGKFTKGMPGLF